MAVRRVLVCGSNYGASYLRALAGAADRYRVVGLLARGSDRSIRVAERYGVPLCTSPDQAPPADLACAALGMDAHSAALRLLERGVSVLCEHPLPVDAVRRSLTAARAAGARFHVNGHWPDLEPARTFIERARGLCGETRVLHLQMTVSDRLLYGALDILGSVLGRLEADVRGVGRADSFVLLHGRLSGIACTARVESSVRPGGRRLADGSPEYSVSYRIALESEQGALSLLGPGGPLVWNANEHRAGDPDRTLWETVRAERASMRTLERDRMAANLRALDRLAREVETGVTPPEQDAEYLASVSAAWEAFGRALG